MEVQSAIRLQQRPLLPGRYVKKNAVRERVGNVSADYTSHKTERICLGMFYFLFLNGDSRVMGSRITVAVAEADFWVTGTETLFDVIRVILNNEHRIKELCCSLRGNNFNME